jgi:ribonuclease-3
MLTSKHVITSANKNIYGNALEALMGAVYLDYGYKRCKSFVSKILIQKYIDLDKVAFADVNFKSKIIEWSQKYHLSIEFALAEEELLTNNQHNFKTNLLISDKFVSEGNGISKKESHQDAAFNAIKLIESNPNFISQLQFSEGIYPNKI